ncbi:hypothetical protein QN277_023732 [Acacia crassicarpa]|uniref:RNase H type-1 domain-containing protein n=1 Tax=Acacia crassicarpa TaxID=499986 RepID=A0AAE1JDR8_9FABA|nr:hypothetical protein QN277_023732 [Acacia crassicarpa]
MDPPPTDAVRIDVDRSVRHQFQATCGGVIRNSDGHWLMGFCKSLDAHTVIEAKLHAIMLGLRVGHHMGLRKILLYSDSLDTVNILMRDCCYVDHPLKEIIKEIRDLLYSDYLDVKIHYTPRDIISFADYMAKEGHNAPANEDVSLIPTIPVGCMEMAMRDQLVCGS